jgi:hypothetical protein
VPIYLITPLAGNFDRLGEAIKRHIPEERDRYALQNKAGWLVSYAGTSVELSHLLEITSANRDEPPGGLGSAMVTSIGSYFGRGSTPMWEWLKTRFENR